MTAAAIVLASVLGSLHCAAMCGGFAVATGGARGGLASLLGYHLGRGLAYVSLGALAGLTAGALDLAGETLLGVQRVAGIALGVLLIALAARELGWLPRRAPLVAIEDRQNPGLIQRLRQTTARLLAKRGVAASFAVGSLSAALPCGWLWGFVALAGATGGWLSGAWVMAAFWAGTVPALLVVGGLSRLIGDGLRQHAPKLTAVGLLMAGVLSLAGKWAPTPESATGDPTQCHTPAPLLETPNP